MARIEVTVREPSHLRHLQLLVAVADALGMTGDAMVDVAAVPGRITVSTNAFGVSVPGGAD